MKIRSLFCFVAIQSIIAASLVSSPVYGASLYFYKTPVKTSSEKICYSFARDTARHLGFVRVHNNNLEVAGEKDGAYVSITCIGRGSKLQAMAVVMSVADNFEVAKRVGILAGEKIKAIQMID